jgi:hypothetical protein
MRGGIQVSKRLAGIGPRIWPSHRESKFGGMCMETELTDLEASDREIEVCPLHVEILAHAAHVCVAEVRLIQPFREEGQAAVREDEEVNLVK